MSTSRDIAARVVDGISFGKLTGEAGLTDYDPLVTVMYLVAWNIEKRGGSFDKPKARRVWLQAIMELQSRITDIEHNNLIPCRYCNQAFEPEVNEALLTTFLAWYDSREIRDLLAIHKCPTCGGQLNARRLESYQGDWHTPPPGTIESDEEWCDSLLRRAPL